MAKLFYRLIYILPLSLFGTVLICNAAFSEPLTAKEVIPAVLFAALVPILSRLSTQLKIVVSGGVLVVTGAVVFVVLRLDKASDHAGLIRELTVILIALALSGVTFFAIKSRFIKLVISVGLVAFLIVSMVLGYVVTRLELWFCIVPVLSFVAEEIQRLYRRGDSFDAEKYVTFVWPFVLALTLCIVAFKAPSHPYDWKLFIKMYERGRELTIEIREKLFAAHSEDYNDSMIGFSGDARIGGSLGGKSEEIMSISTAKREGQTIYLTGKVFSDFSGREWTAGVPFNDKERLLDALIAINSAQIYGGEDWYDYLKLERMDITFLPFSSRYIFAPSKYLHITVDGEFYVPENADGAIFFDDTRIINAQYKVLYPNINMNPAAITRVTSGELASDEASWNRTLASYADGDSEGVSFADKENYEAFVKDHYLTPVNVSGSVAESIEKISESADTDFDRLKYLESALKGMTYTNSTDKLPEKVTDAESYLSYFLTESQEGYCVHYATAFCLMARAMGYPSRYVQGYMVTVGQSDDTRVDSSMAHAWAEVWLEGLGWVIFEPTPGARVSGNSWTIKDEKQESAASQAGLIGSRTEEYETAGGEELFELSEEQEEKAHINWFVYIIPILSFIVFAVLFLAADSLLAAHRLKVSPDDEKACILSRRILKMLGYMGLSITGGETLSEFMNRADEEYGECIAFIPYFERVLYSDKAIDRDSLTAIQICEEKTAGLLKSKKKMLYLFYRFKSIHGR